MILNPAQAAQQQAQPAEPNEDVHAEQLDRACGVSRRGFFTALAESPGAGLAVGAIIGVPAALAARSVVSNQQCTRCSVTLPHGGRLAVIGVMHNDDWAGAHADLITREIAGTDLVLAERHPWFDRYVLAPARSRGKEAAYIESESSLQRGLYTSMAGAGVLFGLALGRYILPALSKLLDDAAGAPEQQPGRPVSRRHGVLALLGAYLGLTYAASPLSAAASITGIHGLAAAEISQVGDGRSVKMLSNARRWGEQRPGRNVTVFAGDGHAAAMECYLNSRIGRRIFNIKQPIYEAAYLNCLDDSAPQP